MRMYTRFGARKSSIEIGVELQSYRQRGESFDQQCVTYAVHTLAQERCRVVWVCDTNALPLVYQPDTSGKLRSPQACTAHITTAQHAIAPS